MKRIDRLITGSEQRIIIDKSKQLREKEKTATLRGCFKTVISIYMSETTTYTITASEQEPVGRSDRPTDDRVDRNGSDRPEIEKRVDRRRRHRPSSHDDDK